MNNITLDREQQIKVAEWYSKTNKSEKKLKKLTMKDLLDCGGETVKPYKYNKNHSSFNSDKIRAYRMQEEFGASMVIKP
jgi:hypothetical protein